MNNDEAYGQFSDWYENCIENGIDPEEIVARMGEMMLITDIEIIEFLEESGKI
jgi:hypothetical protein